MEESAQYAVGLLEDSAEQHFLEVIRGIDLATMTWETFKEILLAAYSPLELDFASRVELRNLKQEAHQENEAVLS